MESQLARTKPSREGFSLMTVRLNRYLAQCGVCSRRHADKIILSGRVTVNGEITDALGVQIDTLRDTVAVDGRALEPRAETRVLLFNKPPGVLTTCRRSREKGRTILDYLPRDRRYFPVGRLDKDSGGLLIVTDDGDLAHRLTHPRFGSRKVYKVKTVPPLDRRQIQELISGVKLEDGPARALAARKLASGELEISLGEGRKRQLRRMIAAVGARVVQLTRVAQANLKLGSLETGAWRDLTPSELDRLRIAPTESNNTDHGGHRNVSRGRSKSAHS